MHTHDVLMVIVILWLKLMQFLFVSISIIVCFFFFFFLFPHFKDLILHHDNHCYYYTGHRNKPSTIIKDFNRVSPVQ